jgi:hypothetical protein
MIVSLAGFRVVGFVGARGVAHSIHKMIIKCTDAINIIWNSTMSISVT